jgi:hypothetical protein
MTKNHKPTISERGNQLLLRHNRIYQQLKLIPDHRIMIFREEYEGDLRFGKPRFVDPNYKWDQTLLRTLQVHLNQLWQFFYDYNYYLDESLMHLISKKLRKKSKKSIIFLLENDIWCTDEVYGKYLIEKETDRTTLSYYRFNTKLKAFHIPTTKETELQEWIINDARRQVKEQFKESWSKLKDAIKECMREKYLFEPKIYVSDDYLKEQIKLTAKTAEAWPEGAILSLGRIGEILLLKLLGKRRKELKEDLIDTAYLAGKIQAHQKKILIKIRAEYNLVKHNPFKKSDVSITKDLIEQFQKVIKI